MKCKVHSETELICPRCVGSKGGKKSNENLTRKELSERGKRAAQGKNDKAESLQDWRPSW